MAPPPEHNAALLDHLEAQRHHVLGILGGLDEDALQATWLRSGWSCLGLLRHLTIDVERFWFRGVVAGEPAVIDRPVRLGSSWQLPIDATAASVVDAYRHECQVASRIIATTPARAQPAWWPRDQLGDWRRGDVEEVLLHVITETACHAGHLDIVREMIDGRQWRVLP